MAISATLLTLKVFEASCLDASSSGYAKQIMRILGACHGVKDVQLIRFRRRISANQMNYKWLELFHQSGLNWPVVALNFNCHIVIAVFYLTVYILFACNIIGAKNPRNTALKLFDFLENTTASIESLRAVKFLPNSPLAILSVARGLPKLCMAAMKDHNSNLDNIFEDHQ